MEENRLKNLYLRLSLVSVFHNVMKKPVLKDFCAYATSERAEDRLKAYASMVTGIYENGGTLDGYIRKAVFEDENIYVRLRAKKISVDEKLERGEWRHLSEIEQSALEERGVKVTKSK